MENDFKLFKYITPNQNVPINKRFAKLTLSSHKKIVKEADSKIELNSSPKKLIMTNENPFDVVLTDDDDSEDGSEPLNRILLSKSSTKTGHTKRSIESNNKRITNSFQGDLQVSDSDETHCSFDIFDAINLSQENNDQERRLIEDNERSKSCATKETKSNTVSRLSDQISNLQLGDGPKCNDVTDSLIEKYKVMSTIGEELSISDNSFHTPESSNVLANDSIISVSSDISQSESEDLIVISDSEEELVGYPQPSPCLKTDNTLSSLNTTAAERLDYFFNNMPLSSPGFSEKSDIRENTEKVNDKIDAILSPPTRLHNYSNENKNMDPTIADDSITDESIEIPESSVEEEQVNNQKEPTTKYISTPQSNNKSNSQIKDNKVNSGTTPNSEKKSSTCIETINISAKIKINLKISEPIIHEMQLSSSDNESSKSSKNDEAQQENSDKSMTNNIVNYKKQVQNDFVTPKSCRNISKEYSDPDDEIDDADENLLNKIYGNDWRTPEIIHKLDKKKHSEKKIPDQSRLEDFSNFHQNIRTDFESTRINSDPVDKTSPTTKHSIFKKPFMLDNKMPIVTRTAKKNIKYNVDSSTEENQSDEDSWKGSDTSDSSNNNSKMSIKTTNKKKQKKKDEIVYLDLSNDIIKVQQENEDPEANNDEEFNKRLRDILKTCKFKEKSPFDDDEKTPNRNIRTKRKLFTPRFGYEDDLLDAVKPLDDVPVRSANSDEIESIQISTPLPRIFAPVNKQLEAVKTGTPIFRIKKLTESAKKKDLSEFPETPNGKTKQTPSRSNKRNVMNEIRNTPSNKYGFLKSLDVTVSKKYCHPDALIYIENYKNKKDELAQKLYDLYNQQVFNNELNVAITWNKKLLNTAGRCSNSKKSGIRTSRIELSEKVITSADRLRCTLIHELCHAATWIFNEENGHGATWKAWTKKANTIFPELPKIGVCHQYDIEYKYTYKCTLCGARSHAHSKSKKVDNIRCAYCHGAIEIFLNKKDKEGNVIPTPVKEPTGFAKFVKEKYKEFKTPDLKHAEVMRILSNEFASLKCK